MNAGAMIEAPQPRFQIEGVPSKVVALRKRQAKMIHGARLSINSSNRWPASNCIYQQFTLRKANERLSLQCPKVLGIDEHTLHKAKRWEFPTEVIFLRRIMSISPRYY